MRPARRSYAGEGRYRLAIFVSCVQPTHVFVLRLPGSPAGPNPILGVDPICSSFSPPAQSVAQALIPFAGPDVFFFFHLRNHAVCKVFTEHPIWARTGYLPVI